MSTLYKAGRSLGAFQRGTVTLPRSCPDCGAGVVIGQAIAVCEANKYASRSGAGDCRWTLVLTPDLRRQADEALLSRVETADSPAA